MSGHMVKNNEHDLRFLAMFRFAASLSYRPRHGSCSETECAVAIRLQVNLALFPHAHSPWCVITELMSFVFALRSHLVAGRHPHRH